MSTPFSKVIEALNLTKKQKRKIIQTPVYKRVGLSRREYYDDDLIKPHERRFLQRFTRRGEKIKWIKRDDINVETGGYYPTNDFEWKKEQWELKEPKRKRYCRIAKMIRESSSIKENFMIDFGNTEITEVLARQLAMYNINNPKRIIKKLYIFSRGKTWKILLRKN